MTTDAKHKDAGWTWAPGDYEQDGEDRYCVQGATVFTPEGKSFFTEDCGDWFGLSDEMAERIAACFNACQGIPTEQLEKGCVERLVRAARAVLNPSESDAPPWNLRDAIAPFDKDQQP